MSARDPARRVYQGRMMTDKKVDKRKKYDLKMKALGFKKIQPYVHVDDRDYVLKITEDLKNKRLK